MFSAEYSALVAFGVSLVCVCTSTDVNIGQRPMILLSGRFIAEIVMGYIYRGTDMFIL